MCVAPTTVTVTGERPKSHGSRKEIILRNRGYKTLPSIHPFHPSSSPRSFPPCLPSTVSPEHFPLCPLQRSAALQARLPAERADQTRGPGIVLFSLLPPCFTGGLHPESILPCPRRLRLHRLPLLVPRLVNDVLQAPHILACHLLTPTTLPVPLRLHLSVPTRHSDVVRV